MKSNVEKVKASHIEGGRWKIFRPPQEGYTYVMGCDTASGKFKANESCATILCVNDGRQDAICAGQINPDEMAAEVEKGGYFYNTATTAIENEKHGITIINYLRGRDYPNIYFHRSKIGHMAGASANEWGWDPTHNRQTAIDWLQADIGNCISTKKAERDRAVYFFDPETITQFGLFIPNAKTGKYQAQPGMMDDRVSAAYIANWVRREVYSDIYRPEKPKPLPKTFLEKLNENNETRDDRSMGPREYS